MFSKIAAMNSLKNVMKFRSGYFNNLLHTSPICYKKKKKCGPPKVAVILCGCGALDGTEISEAISAAIHLSAKGAVPNFYAPNISICATVNHLTQDADDSGPARDALVEGARLARSCIRPLCECTCCENSGVIIPGGWGVARTLSDFASKGCDCIVLPELEKVIMEFSCASKPIGAICVAAAIVAKVLDGPRVTLGMDAPKDRWQYSDAIEKARQMGADVELRDVKGVTHCKEHNVFSTPAWMDTQATYAEIHEGIGKMVGMMKKHIK